MLLSHGARAGSLPALAPKNSLILFLRSTSSCHAVAIICHHSSFGMVTKNTMDKRIDTLPESVPAPWPSRERLEGKIPMIYPILVWHDAATLTHPILVLVVFLEERDGHERLEWGTSCRSLGGFRGRSGRIFPPHPPNCRLPLWTVRGSLGRHASFLGRSYMSLSVAFTRQLSATASLVAKAGPRYHTQLLLGRGVQEPPHATSKTLE